MVAIIQNSIASRTSVIVKPSATPKPAKGKVVSVSTEQSKKAPTRKAENSIENMICLHILATFFVLEIRFSSELFRTALLHVHCSAHKSQIVVNVTDSDSPCVDYYLVLTWCATSQRCKV